MIAGRRRLWQVNVATSNIQMRSDHNVVCKPSADLWLRFKAHTRQHELYFCGVISVCRRPETQSSADVRACVLSVGVLPGAVRRRRGAGDRACALRPDAHQPLRARTLRLRRLFRRRGWCAGPSLLWTTVLQHPRPRRQLRQRSALPRRPQVLPRGPTPVSQRFASEQTVLYMLRIIITTTE